MKNNIAKFFSELINFEDIKGNSALTILEKYTGLNPYIRGMKKDYLNNGFKLTETQIKYVMDNHEKEPILINRVIRITPYLGEELQRQHNIKFVPEKILIEYLLADNDKTYHVYGKLKQNQNESKMYFLPKTQVLDDPYFENIPVQVDFSKYNATLASYGKKLYIHQEEGVKFLLPRNGAILADDMGLGKGLTINTLVYTPNGFKEIGNLKVNDKVIGSDGLPYNVTGIFPQGLKDLYKVTFNDGYSILTDKEHLWSVSSSNHGSNTKNDRVKRSLILSTGQLVDKNHEIVISGSGRNASKKYKVKTFYKQSNGNLKWQIPIVKPIEFDNKDKLPIDPYLLGLGLGDGSFNNRSIRFCNHKDDFEELFYNIPIKEYSPVDNKRYCVINVGDSLFNLGIEHTRSNTKFIPDIYKYSSIENRIAILQGLMDTDGHCMKGKKNGNFNGVEFCSVSEQLADNVAEIVHSLGGIVRKSSQIGSYTKNGIKIVCKRKYRLNIKMPEGINPFRLARKAECYKTPKKYKIGRYIKNIEKWGTGETVCISVDSSDKLYVTEHAIVTHNTTTSIIAALELGAKKVLVVCPSSAKINWKREIGIFCEDVTIVDGQNWETAKFTIINYDILKNFHTVDKNRKKNPDQVVELNRHIVEANFDLIIMDEAHYLKNNDSIRGQIMADLVTKHNIKTVWLLTGTPISNRPMDFFNLLKIIRSQMAENWQYFAKRYCDGRKIFRTLKNGKKQQIWLTDGASNLDELAQKSRNLILRRLKKDVLDLPDKIIIPVYHELSTKGWDEYDKLWDNYVTKRREEKKRTYVSQRDLIELGLLRKFIAMQAIPETIEMTENALEMGKKVVIFTNFTEELEVLQNHFGKHCVIHNGPMTDVQKQRSVDSFQNNDKIKVFIGNIMSAGVAITLTQATVVIFNSYDWVPGVNEQAEDRAYRIGQNEMVTVYYQLFEDTISERMWSTLKYKKGVISAIMGDNKLSEVDIIEALMDEIKTYE